MSPPSTLSTCLVTAYVTAALGREVTEVQPLQGSVANQDFLVRLADDTSVVIKVGPAREMAAEARACQRMTEVGVPVPAVVAFDLRSGIGGLPTLILSFVPGAPSESREVAFQTGRWFRRVHAEHLLGWGPLTFDGPTERSPVRGAYDTWLEAVSAELAGLPELVDAGLLEENLARMARTAVLTHDLVEYRGPGALLHNDLKAAHLFSVDDQRLSGIIDWGDARVGDPTADIARLSMAGPTITEAFLAGYELRLTDALVDRLARYRILWNVAALTYEHRAGGDWFDVYRERIRADTRRL